ncbi:ComEA family DNA-binding protein [Nocardioides caldifontis]|uniref:ComEA family DNA-binding protein n=1 Tax=Nocardioides caldifontis TaxID=2588938 RepID=UPI00193A501B|nr:helix-hairpin-helix domain-containing protein [Nocardioides caldifontis]
MSYGSSDRRPHGDGSAQLADRGWRFRHSLWLLAPLLGCGAFSFVGFLYCAIRVGTRRWWLIATFWTVASLAVWTMAIVQGEVGRDGPYDDIGAVLLIVVYLGAIVHGFIVNRDYLRWRATSRPWYSHAAPVAAPVTTQLPTAPPAPLAPPPFGVETAPYYAPPPAPPAPPAPAPDLLDLNSATVEQLALLPGVDDATAARIVAAREARGCFADLDDAVRGAGLQPHQLVRLRDHVTVGPVGQQRPSPDREPPAGRGRVLDI